MITGGGSASFPGPSGHLLQSDGTDSGVATASVASAITEAAGALQTTGGTMSGAIAMGSNKITGLTNGSGAQDAAAYGQIGAAVAALGAGALGWIDITQSPYNADKTGTNDCTSAIQSAINAAVTAGGGTIYFPAGTYLMSASQTTGGSGGQAYSGQVVFPARNLTVGQVVVRLLGAVPTPQTMWGSWAGTAVPVEVGGSILNSTATSGNVFDVNTVGGFTFDGYYFSNVQVNFDSLLIRCPNNPQCGGLRLDRAYSACIDNCTVGVNAAATAITQPTGGTYAIQMPQINNGTGNGIRRSQVYGFAYGLAHSEHVLLDSFAAEICLVGIAPQLMNHQAEYRKVLIQGCVTNIQTAAANCYIEGTVDFENEGSGWWANQYDILDGGGHLYGRLGLKNIAQTATFALKSVFNARIYSLSSATYIDSQNPTAVTDSLTSRTSAYTLGQLDSGQLWYQGGTWTVSASGAKGPVGNNPALVTLFPATIDPHDFVIQTTVKLSTNGDQAGVCFHADYSNDMIYAWVQGSSNGNQLQLGKVVGGTYTTLANSSGFSPVTGTNYTIKAVVTDTTITVSVNGTVYITYTLTSTDKSQLAANTLMGLSGYTPGNCVYTNFSVTSPTTSGTVMQGTAVLSSGTIAVANTSITANSLIRVTNIAASGTVGALSVALTAGTGFAINSTSGSDASTIFWEIVSY